MVRRYRCVASFLNQTRLILLVPRLGGTSELEMDDSRIEVISSFAYILLLILAALPDHPNLQYRDQHTYITFKA